MFLLSLYKLRACLGASKSCSFKMQVSFACSLMQRSIIHTCFQKKYAVMLIRVHICPNSHFYDRLEAASHICDGFEGCRTCHFVVQTPRYQEVPYHPNTRQTNASRRTCHIDSLRAGRWLCCTQEERLKPPLGWGDANLDSRIDFSTCFQASGTHLLPLRSMNRLRRYVRGWKGMDKLVVSGRFGRLTSTTRLKTLSKR